MRPAQLRRLLAAGKISPAEIADYEKQVAVRQERRAGEMEAWLDKIAENRHDPIYVGMMWAPPGRWSKRFGPEVSRTATSIQTRSFLLVAAPKAPTCRKIKKERKNVV